MKTQRAIFFDRDGVLNDVIVDGEGIRSPRALGEFRIKEGAREVVQRVKERGYLAIVVTNQPEVKRNLLDKDELDCMHAALKKELGVDDVLVCLHDNDDGCACRKPKPGMLLDAARKWNIDLSQSFIVGDTWRDVGAGEAAGVKTILIDADYNQASGADYRVGALGEILAIV